jgi:hypothetical protein
MDDSIGEDEFINHVYIFYDKGRFSYSSFLKGKQRSGIADYYGTYRVQGSKVILLEVKHTWSPHGETAQKEPGFKDRAEADIELEFSLENSNTTLLISSLALYDQDKDKKSFKREEK